jgi:hypothetical protein
LGREITEIQNIHTHSPRRKPPEQKLIKDGSIKELRTSWRTSVVVRNKRQKVGQRLSHTSP